MDSMADEQLLTAPTETESEVAQPFNRRVRTSAMSHLAGLKETIDATLNRISSSGCCEVV